MISIKLARHGLKNTPFYHIVVLQSRSRPTKKPIEQLGTYNPIPDQNGVKAITLNFERTKYWIGVGAKPSDSVARLLAKADIIPPKPRPGMPNPSSSTPVTNAPASTTP
ncbi:37S ribosomal protein S16, mitochondrial [Mortierella sp. NVP85]|nr:37S ribosomal protein S16, mitochondrial [Mortierella sp. NVP85]